jgi:hypothetical protein
LKEVCFLRQEAHISGEEICAFPIEDAALPRSMAWDQPSLFIDAGQHVLTTFLKKKLILKGASSPD